MKFAIGDKVRVYQGHAGANAPVLCVGTIVAFDQTLGHLTDLMEVEIENNLQRILVRELQCEKID